MNAPTPETKYALSVILEEHGELCEETAPLILVRLCKKLERERDELNERLIDWRDQSNEGLRLRCGELTSQEIRTIRAVLGDILPPEPQTELNDRLIDRKPCDWKQDDDGNWDTACKQCLCFDYAPPFEDFGGME